MGASERVFADADLGVTVGELEVVYGAGARLGDGVETAFCRGGWHGERRTREIR